MVPSISTASITRESARVTGAATGASAVSVGANWRVIVAFLVGCGRAVVGATVPPGFAARLCRQAVCERDA